jgi:hypothetical protein
LLWKRLGAERRQSIDIDAVIDAKYPNRTEAQAAEDNFWNRRVENDVVDLLGEDELVDLVGDERPAVAMPPAPLPSPISSALSSPGPSSPYVATGFPQPVPTLAADEPIPGEPDELDVREYRSTAPPAVVDVDLGTDPYLQIKRRRDRVAAQAAETFREVHRLRTEALRRASQAEHNASLATGARTRAGRMVRDIRRVESQGRHRPSDMPSSDDAYDDVHHFRTEALKRAQQAEHGAQKVSQARERAARLLTEQRQLEAEMARMQKRRTRALPR